MALTALLASLLAVVPATTASAADRTFLVNSLSPVGDDANVGDGICATAAGECTLRAALQESNAIGTTDTVTIAPAEDVDASTPGVQSTGTIVGNATTAAAWMYSGALTPLGDAGAYFMATAPVSLDFQGRLGIASLNDAYGSTAIYINGPGVALRNFTNVKSNETAVVVGPAGDGAVIENGSSLDPGSINLERFLWLANGADQVTVRTVEIGSTYAGGGSAIRIAAGATVDGLTLDSIHMFDPDTERYTGFQGQGVATLSNLTIVGSRFEGFGGANFALDLRSLTLTNAQIVGNTFTRNSLAGGYTLVYLNTPGLGAPNVISGNTFDNAGTNAGTTSYAVYAVLGRTAAQQSGWRIEDNYFNGFTSSSVYLSGSGILTAQRNTFGTASYGGIAAGNETSAVSMLTNATTASNSQISTWYPTATSYDSAQCTLSISVTPPSTGTVPTVPVSIDAYYLPSGATSGATVYLGRQALSAAGQITVPYTLGPGLIRVQTIDATGRASQYSRTVQQTQADLCGPRVTVDQAASQADPTSVRDLRFTVAVSEPLATTGAGALTASDFSTAGSTAPGAGVTAVTKVNDTLYTVTARANASGTVQLALPAGAVTDGLGNLSAASTSTDGSVTYVSPLTVAPTSITVAEGDSETSYTVTSTLAATAPILVAATVGTPAWATVTPATASLPTTASAVSLAVAAVDDSETNGTRQTTVTHTVTSTDQNFDGLLLPPVDLTVLDDDVVDVAQSTLTVEPGTAVADGVDSLTATVTARNSSGGLVAGVPLVVSVSPGAAPASTTCTTSAEGACSVPVTSTTPGTYQVSATLGGDAVQGSPASVTFVAGPGDATTSTISASVNELVADNASQSQITVELRDAFGHPLTTSGGTVAIATSEGTVGPTTDNGDGTYSATLTAPSEVSVATVSFTLDAVVGARTTTVTFVPGDASPARSTIVVADPTLVADGAATTGVTVTLLDGFDNPLTASGGTVVVETSAGTVSPASDNGDGTYTATLTASTATGTAVLSFTVDGIQATATTEVELVAGPVDLTLSTITADPVAITADRTSTAVATVRLRDAAGNVITTGGGDVVVSSDLGTITGTVDQGNGTYTATLTSTATPGTATLTFSVGGVDGSAQATVDFVVGSADPTTSTIDAAPTSIVADETSTSTVTVRLRDSQGTALETSGGVVVISTDLGSVSTTTDNGDGTYSAVLTSSSTTGSATLSFAIGAEEATSTASVAFVPGPVDLGLSEISADPTEILADGSSTSLVSVQLKDAQGNDLVGSTDVVSITTDLGTLTATTAGGDGLYTATLTSGTTAGTATLAYAVGGIDAPGTAQVELLVGAVDLATSTIVATPESIVADGTSTSQVVVQLRDTNGNPLTTSGGTVVIATDAGDVGATTDVGDGTYTAELTSSTTAGTATLSFTLDDLAAPATASVDFVAGTADLTTSTIEASPTSITADGTSTSTVTVRLLDGNGNPLTSSGGTVLLSSDLGALGATTDVGDGTYTAELTSSTAAGTATVSFALDDVAAPATASVEMVAGAADPSTSTIEASPTSITAHGASTSTVTVRLLDANGNALTTSGGTVVISTDAGTVGATTDVGDGTYTAVLTSSTIAGSATLSFTVDDVAGGASAAVEFVAGPADAGTSTIEASPTSITADSTSTSTITVRLLDADGNPLTTSGGTVVIATDAGTVGPTTDVGDGSYTAELTSSTAAGTATVSFALDDVAAPATASVEMVAGAADPSTSTIEASPTSITADGASTSTVTVRLLDANGNALTTSGGTVVISTDAGTVGATTDVGDGTYTAELTSSTTAGTATLSFTFDDEIAASTTSVEFTAGTADLTTSTIEASPASIAADGVSTSTVTVRLLDGNGNPLTSSGGTVVVSSDAGSVGATTDVGDGTYTAELTSSTTAETATVSFTLDGVAGEQTASVVFVPGAADPGLSTIEASPTSITADGASTSTVTVRLVDANGNPLVASGGEVVVFSSRGEVLGTVDEEDGTYTAVLRSSTAAGVAAVGFTVEGVVAGPTVPVTFVAGEASADLSEISASPASITADGASTSTVTVQLVDATGNPLTSSGGVVVIATDAGTLGATTDVGDGTYTAELMSSTTAGTATVSFTLDGADAEQTTSVAFTPGDVDLSESTITASPTMILADGTSTSTVTVTLLDSNGNPTGTSGGTVVVATDLGTVGATTDLGDGTYSAVLTSAQTAGTATVSFALDGAGAPATAAVVFTAGAVDLGTSTIEADPTLIAADGTSTSTVTVRLFDLNGNPLTASGGTVVVSTDAGTVGPTTDAGDGTYTAELTSSTTAGTATLSFTLDDVAAPATATVELVAGPSDAGTSTIEADPTSITADGVSTSTVTVRSVDANGNPLTSSGGTVVVSSDAGSVGATTDVGDGTYTAVLTSSATTGTATVSFTLDGVAGAQTASVVFVPGAADPAASTIEASPTSITADGVSTSTVTVRLVDRNGNALVASGGEVVVFSSRGEVLSTVDEGDGSYTAVLRSSTDAGVAAVGFTVEGVVAGPTVPVTFVAGEASADLSEISASPASITADGASTSTVTVQLVDATGNPLTSSGGVVVIATDAGTLGATTDVGDGTYTAELRSATTAGTATLSFTLDDETASSTTSVEFTAGAADLTASTIEASPTSITADGTSTSTVTVRLVDANGNPLTTSGGTVLVATDLGSVSSTTDVGDGTFTATLTSGTVAGPATVTFTVDDQLAESSATVDLLPAAADPTASTIEASPTTITADGASTSTVTVRLIDANGNALTTSGGAVVISTDAGTVGATTDVGDGTYTAELTSGTTAGSATLSFTLDDVLAEATAAVDLVAGPADAGTSTIEASPTSITADGTSTSTVTVRLLDANGNPLTSSGGTVVITTDAGTLGATTDGGDGTYTAELTSATTAGTATLSFALDDVPAEATTTVAFTAGAADLTTSTIEADPTTLTADGTSTSTVTVRLVDGNGNPLTSSGGAVVVTSDLGTAGAVTDLGDGTYTAVFTAATTVGTATLGFTLDGTTAGATATVDLVAGAADPTRTTVEVFPTTLVADGTTTATVTVRTVDAQGNPVTTGGVPVTVTTDLGSVGPVTDLGDGTYTATLTSATTAGTATVGFTLDGAAGAQTAQALFVAGPGDPARSVVEADPTSITADGVSTSTLTVRLIDVNGNPLTSSGGTVVLTTDAGSVSATTDQGDGTYTATLLAPTTTGTATVSFSVDGVLAEATTTVDLVAGAADPTVTTIEASPGQIVADGVSTSVVTVRLRDALGNPITSSRGTVVVSTDAGTVSGTTDVGDGTSTATLTSASTAGVATLTFTLDGTPGLETAAVTFVAGTASPTTSTIEASPDVLPADGTSTSEVTVRLRDANGNPLTSSGGTVVVSTTTGSVTAATDNGDGTYSATFTAATTPGTAVLSFTVGGVAADGTSTVELVVGAGDPSTSTISASESTLVVGDDVESAITVQLRDLAGNPLTASGGAVVIATDAGTLSATTDNGDGTYSAVLTAPLVTGQATVGFTLDGAPGTRTLVVTFVEGSTSPSTSQISAAPSSIVADGVDGSTVTVRLFDGFGNPLGSSGGTVVITTSLGDVTTTTDLGDGTYTARLTGTSAGTATLGFSIDGAQASATTDVSLVAGGADPTTSTISASPTVLVADGTSTSAVTVRLRDAQGNPLTSGGGTVTLSTDLGTLSGVTDNGDGSSTATLTSATTAGTATVSFAVDGVPGTGTATVDLVAGPPSPVTSTITAAPTTIESGGVDASTLTVRLVDAAGNPLTQGGAAVVISSDLGEVSPTVDQGDGTYTATLVSLGTGTATAGFTVGGTTADATTAVEVVDTTAAEAPAILAPTDGSRVSPTVQISGSGASGATLTVSVVGGAELCTVVVTTSGTWACTPAEPLPEGPVTFVASQVDEAGNPSADSTPVSVVVDGTAPPAPELDPTAGDLVTGLSEPGTTVTVSDSGGTVLCTATAGPDGRFVCDPAEQVPAGTLLSATATDEAGNTSEASFVRVGGASVTLEADSLRSGAEQVAYGRGFLPGESVSGLLESTPVDLGTQVADADGTVTFSFLLPVDIELGAHTVTLTGERSGSVTADFEVVAAPVDPTPVPPTTVPPTAPPTAAPGVPGTSVPVAPSPGTPGNGLLSRTGADPAGALLAAASVLLGMLLLGASRRRRREDV